MLASIMFTLRASESLIPSRRLHHPLTAAERSGILVAVQSTFCRLKHLYDRTRPIYDEARSDLL
jgi:hypothetical protein